MPESLFQYLPDPPIMFQTYIHLYYKMNTPTLVLKNDDGMFRSFLYVVLIPSVPLHELAIMYHVNVLLPSSVKLSFHIHEVYINLLLYQPDSISYLLVLIR